MTFLKYTKNTDKDYWHKEHSNANCGSYALNVKEWLVPYEQDWEDRMLSIQDSLSKGKSVLDIANELARQDIQDLIQIFPEFKVISLSDALLLDDEIELIAYKVGLTINNIQDAITAPIDDIEVYIDSDFHFRVRRHGIWTEKLGGCEIIESDSLETLFFDWNIEGYKYISQTIFLIKI